MLEIYVFVRVLSASSWNYLGAKLIALDPTSRCNRLSANLGFSQCSQVAPGQPCCTELSTALVSQGLDPWHRLSGSPLPRILFLHCRSPLSHWEAFGKLHLFIVESTWPSSSLHTSPLYSHNCFTSLTEPSPYFIFSLAPEPSS